MKHSLFGQRPVSFKKYPNMISYYISLLYIYNRATGDLEKYEKELYLLTWLCSVVGLLILIYRRMMGRPLHSFFLWGLTGIYSDLPLLIAKTLLIVDLLRNKLPISLESLRNSILVFLVYVQIADISVYF